MVKKFFQRLKIYNYVVGVDVTDCLTSRGHEKGKQSPFLKKFLRQLQSSTPEPEPGRAKIILFMA